MNTSWYWRLFTRRSEAAASDVRARAEAGDTQAQMEMAGAWEQMALDMSAEEVAEGNQRAARFVAPTSDAR